MSKTADALREEFGPWINSHPNAALFDWEVAANNIFDVFDKHEPEPADKLIDVGQNFLNLKLTDEQRQQLTSEISKLVITFLLDNGSTR